MRGGISDEEKRDRARAARERLRRGDHGRRVRSEERGSVSAARGAAASDGMSASPDEVSAPSEERTHLLDRLQPDEERDLPPVVCDAESAPEGPPWHYDLSDEERAAREEKRETRQEKRDRLKQKALNKTPDKLRNPSDLQVRFRTGVIYTAATVICVLAGNIPMVFMLAVTLTSLCMTLQSKALVIMAGGDIFSAVMQATLAVLLLVLALILTVKGVKTLIGAKRSKADA